MIAYMRRKCVRSIFVYLEQSEELKLELVN